MTGPLSSLKVLDLSTLLPGPFATMMLADLGADVLRVEAPHRPDAMRSMPPFDGKVAAWHALLNRSKRSLALNLKKPGAVDLVKRLVSEGGYDIVVEQFRPGVMNRLGIGYEALRAEAPGLIYCAITGYGQTGPYRDRAGHDNNYLALAGVMSHTGRADSGPAALGVQIADVGGGSFGAITGILAAVIYRLHTGVGQMVDISMFDMALAWNALAASVYLVGGQIPGWESMPLNGGRVYDFYRTKDGRYLAVGSLEPKFWRGFCQAIERPDLIEDGFNPDDAAQQTVKAAIRNIILSRDFEAWVALFAALDVCVEPVLTVPEALEHPQTGARHMIVDVPRPRGGSQRQIASPFKFSETEPHYRHTGVAAGAQTMAILRELGYDEDEISTLVRAGALGNGGDASASP